MPPFARDNGLAPDVCQAIVPTNYAISLTEPLRAKYQWSFNLKKTKKTTKKTKQKKNKNKRNFTQENVFEDVVWNRPQHIKRARSNDISIVYLVKRNCFCSKLYWYVFF